MNSHVDPRVAEFALWLAVFGGIACFAGYETEWGLTLLPQPPLVEYAPAKYVPPTLATVPTSNFTPQDLEAVERPLFVFTRRPPPVVPIGVPPPPTMRKGQFTLAGVSIVGEVKIAFLVELATGKMRPTAEGKDLGEIRVSGVYPSHVVLTQGDDSETVGLRIQQPKFGLNPSTQGRVPGTSLPFPLPGAAPATTAPAPVNSDVPPTTATKPEPAKAAASPPVLDFDTTMRRSAAEWEKRRTNPGR